MLIQFRIENHRSFGPEMVLSMEAVKAFKDYSENVFETPEKYRLLKTAAVYGANASGKSNLLQALCFMRNLVLQSAKRNSEETTPTNPFRLDGAFLIKPSLFEVVFLADGHVWRYGFQITFRNVVAEWLFRSTGPRNKEHAVFIRESEAFQVSPDFPEVGELKKHARSNALFLSSLDMLNVHPATSIIQWFTQCVSWTGGSGESGCFCPRQDDSLIYPSWVRFIQETLNDSINAITVPEDGTKPNISVLRISHDKKKNVIPFDLLKDESRGTQEIVSLAVPWLETIKTGGVLIMDEMGANLHPQLTRRLIGMFQSPESNPRNAQLIFATHDTNLLTYGNLRRDQIWFCKKTPSGNTELYSLAEIKVRKEAKFEEGYLQGRYGAVPFFGNTTTLGQGFTS